MNNHRIFQSLKFVLPLAVLSGLYFYTSASNNDGLSESTASDSRKQQSLESENTNPTTAPANARNSGTAPQHVNSSGQTHPKIQTKSGGLPDIPEEELEANIEEDFRQAHADVQEETNTSSYTIEEREQIMNYRRPGRQFNRHEIEQAMQLETVWQSAQSVPTNLNLREQELQDGRVFVDATPLKFETLLKGDTFTIPVPHLEKELKLVVDKIQIKSKTLQWRGRILDDNGGSFIITKGRSTMGSLRMGNKRYIFDINEQGQGWIHNVNKVFHDPVS